MAGDLNTDIVAREGDWQAENIATELATAGLEDMARHFLLRKKRWCRDRRTWGMRRKGQVVLSRTDNTDIVAREGDWQAENIATDLATAGLEDMARHFLPQEKR